MLGFGKESDMGRVESGGAAIWLAGDAASLPNGHTLVGDGGVLASRVNQ